MDGETVKRTVTLRGGLCDGKTVEVDCGCERLVIPGILERGWIGHVTYRQSDDGHDTFVFESQKDRASNIADIRRRHRNNWLF